MLPSVQCSPRNTSRVLALEEERFGFAVLEAEDLAIATDVELALQLSNLISTIPVTPRVHARVHAKVPNHRCWRRGVQADRAFCGQ